MVWFALTFVTLTAFAGLAIEYNRWQQIATRAQKAADAAALAGAVFMPENVGNKAFTTAKTIATENGFTNGNGGVTVTTAPGRLPNQLKVTVAINTKNPWGAIVNYNYTTIVRSAVAEYQLPQNLGSPQNSYGNDPESAAAQPQLWGNVFGPSSNKDKGDAIQSVGATANTTLCNADNCPGAAPSRPEPDYDVNGYFYGIDVPAGTTGALNVQVFDPAFVHVGDNCGDSDANAKNSLNNAATLTAAQIPGYARSPTITPAVRYASAGSSAFCTGDNYYGDGSNTANPWTIWTLRAPDISTWDPTNNPIVCQAEFPGVYPETTNGQPNGTVDATALKTLLQQSTNYPGTNPARTFASFFRQWVSICSVASPVQGTYFLQVQTAKKIDGTATPNGGGSNRFSIRVGAGSNFAAEQRAPRVRQPEDGCLRERDRREHAVLPHPGAARRGRQDAGAELLRHRRRVAARDAGRAPAVGLERDRRGVRELPVHPTPGQRQRPAVGHLQQHRLRVQDHRRVELRDAELQRPVGHVGDPDPGDLHVQLRRSARLLDEAPVHLSRGHERERHDDLECLHPRGARPPHPVVACVQ